MVDIGYQVCEILSSYYRGYPDMDDYLTKILLLMEDQQLRAKLSRMARLKATKYDWDVIADQWFELISSRIGESRATKRWHKLTQV
jgi:glycosyltransferase involved in cell wall biosynthesis